MTKRIALGILLLLLPVSLLAQDKKGAATKQETEAKTLSGISIVGNNETPKSLYIVPWKSSELGKETNLGSDLLDDRMKPVDKDVFMRELDFYELSSANDKKSLNIGTRNQ